MPPPNSRYIPPRTAFGFGRGQPLPGDQNPILSKSSEQRFKDAGLDPFLPYIQDPFEVMARAQAQRQFENQMAVMDAENRFFQDIQDDPSLATTGYQKWLAQNPLGRLSPMVRSYGMAQSQPKRDALEVAAAEMGQPYLDKFRKGREEGLDDLASFARVQSQLAKDKAEGKLEEEKRKNQLQPWTQRLGTTEREEIRNLVKRGKALQDFEDEFAGVLKDNEGLTKDEYVKKFKDAPDFASYQRRRWMDTAQQLVDDYGLTPIEAAKMFNLVPQNEPELPPSTETKAYEAEYKETPAVAPTMNPEGSTGIRASAPPIKTSPEVEKLWEQFIGLENAMSIDPNSTNPSDLAANSELRTEQRGVEKALMEKLGIKDDAKGRRLFQEMWQGRKNSLQKLSDSRGETLAGKPIEKTGATGNTWQIRPA